MAAKKMLRRFRDHQQFLRICQPRRDAKPTCSRCSLITCQRNVTPSSILRTRKVGLKHECKDFYPDSQMSDLQT